MIRTVLLIDDDPAVREALGQTLELADLRPILAGSTLEAKDHIGVDFPGVVVSDIRMPGKDGFALLEHAQTVDPDLPVILLTGQGDIAMAVRGMGAGAFDFLEKPCAPAAFLASIEKALRTRALVMENRALRDQLRSGDAAARMISGRSPQAEALRDGVRRLARTRAEVLISGEPGTGIPKVAEVIHLLSAAAQHPFIKLSAATLEPAGLARAFDEASGGALFLDEVAQLGTAAQFALFERLEAGAAPRVLAGTTRDLGAQVLAGRFHPELHLKLDTTRLRIPPLRERPEDIPVLFRHYLTQACEQADIPPPPVSDDLLARLMAQEWPGNARALMNAAMRFALGVEEPSAGEAAPYARGGLVQQMARVERALLEQALERNGGSATRAAQSLQLPRKTFYDKLARHHIRPDRFRAPTTPDGTRD